MRNAEVETVMILMRITVIVPRTAFYRNSHGKHASSTTSSTIFATYLYQHHHEDTAKMFRATLSSKTTPAETKKIKISALGGCINGKAVGSIVERFKILRALGLSLRDARFAPSMHSGSWGPGNLKVSGCKDSESVERLKPRI